MNTSALKSFAPAVRKQLMEAVTRKLDFALTAKTPDYLTKYAAQVAALQKLEQADRKELIERVAYTWFNRFAALRFLDARGWHPFRARVLTAATTEESQPELLKLIRNGALPEELKAHVDVDRLNKILDGMVPSPDPQGEAYKELVLAACRFYHALLPDLFEKLDDETELLVPDDLLTEHSVVHGFRTEIRDEDCAEVEVLGWLYQFYISEKKDAVMARKSAVPTEDIPAVTQLFTPHWIVRYLVENSLGRLWLLNRPQSKLREHMPYYIEGEAETDFLKIGKPEEVKVIDPASGSGHMLTYAFDLLYRIYEEEGYAPSDIPGLILQHNLYGVDICERAAQLASLALILKARDKSRRFLQAENLVAPRVICLQDVTFEEGELSAYFNALGAQPSTFHPQLTKLLYQFEEAKNFGSLIQPCLDEQAIVSIRLTLEEKYLNSLLFQRATHLKVLRVLEQAAALTQRYQIVVANPPYMGGNQMNPHLKSFIVEHWEDGKGDSYAAFILRNLNLVKKSGMVGMITIPNWMFLKGFDLLRCWLSANAYISSLVHCGRGIWGSDFGSCAFLIQLGAAKGRNGLFKRLFRRQGEVQSIEQLNANFFDAADFPDYSASSMDFQKVPGSPIAYWLSQKILSLFEQLETVGDVADPKQGLATCNNELFLRAWHEVSQSNLGLAMGSRHEAVESRRRWFPYHKGGEFRKWYGNHELIVNWENDGKAIHEFNQLPMDFNGAPLRAKSFYFRSGMTWSSLTAGAFSGRFSPSGFIFDSKGPLLFSRGLVPVEVLTAFFNSKPAHTFLSILAPTLDFTQGPLAKVPFASLRSYEPRILSVAEETIRLARTDWDNFETSWDFRDQPLLRSGLKGATLEASWRSWEAQSIAAIRRMQELETENNRLFIQAYGLEGELQPEVPEEQITLARADVRKDVVAFLSYALGCMMGRCSLDKPGLILADAGDTLENYLAKIGKPQDQITFLPDADGIVPVLEGEWFEDDIVARTREFLRATFGEATLRENLRFIEESLGKDLRKYFVNDFYKDHLQTYKKRPIYWLVQSPKKGFSALIYLHRYTKDTMNVILNRYLREYQVKLRNHLAHLTEQEATATSTKDKTAARKEADKLKKILHECEEWERQVVLPLAQQRIELDLDDGVKVNYLKLGEALAPIAGLATKEED